jgi:regulator of protease activity HflC (stomatin/prohibitin superfamily)
LPFGITDVWKLPVELQRVEMVRTVGRGDRQERDDLKVKTRDGANVEVNVMIQFKILREKGAEIVKSLGNDMANWKKLIRAYSRAYLRDELGKLAIDSGEGVGSGDEDAEKEDAQESQPAISNAKDRLVAIDAAKKRLNLVLEQYGLVVDQVSVTDLRFDPKYERKIKERKSTDQEFRTQISAFESERQNQKRAKAEATRIKTFTIVEARGIQRKTVIAAEGEAAAMLEEAQADAIRMREQGEQQYQVFHNDAQAVETELLKKAEGIKKLAEAYETGGLALVREALARKYAGKIINGRPYSLESTVQRLQIEKAAAAAVRRKR